MLRSKGISYCRALVFSGSESWKIYCIHLEAITFNIIQGWIIVTLYFGDLPLFEFASAFIRWQSCWRSRCATAFSQASFCWALLWLHQHRQAVYEKLAALTRKTQDRLRSIQDWRWQEKSKRFLVLFNCDLVQETAIRKTPLATTTVTLSGIKTWPVRFCWWLMNRSRKVTQWRDMLRSESRNGSFYRSVLVPLCGKEYAARLTHSVLNLSS